MTNDIAKFRGSFDMTEEAMKQEVDMIKNLKLPQEDDKMEEILEVMGWESVGLASYFVKNGYFIHAYSKMGGYIAFEHVKPISMSEFLEVATISNKFEVVLSEMKIRDGFFENDNLYWSLVGNNGLVYLFMFSELFRDANIDFSYTVANIFRVSNKDLYEETENRKNEFIEGDNEKDD